LKKSPATTMHRIIFQQVEVLLNQGLNIFRRVMKRIPEAAAGAVYS